MINLCQRMFVCMCFSLLFSPWLGGLGVEYQQIQCFYGYVDSMNNKLQLELCLFCTLVENQKWFKRYSFFIFGADMPKMVNVYVLLIRWLHHLIWLSGLFAFNVLLLCFCISILNFVTWCDLFPLLSLIIFQLLSNTMHPKQLSLGITPILVFLNYMVIER